MLLNAPRVSSNFYLFIYFAVAHTANLYDNFLLYATEARAGHDLMPRQREGEPGKGGKKFKGCLKAKETNSDAAEIL